MYFVQLRLLPKTPKPLILLKQIKLNFITNHRIRLKSGFTTIL